MARLDELERKFEENPRRYFAPLANEYRKAGDPKRAAELCRSQLPDIPGHISGHIVLGQALFDSGDFAGSRAALETALTLDPENIVALRYLGDIASATGDAAEGERWYSRTLEADPYNEVATQALQLLRESASAAAAAAAASGEANPVASGEAIPVAIDEAILAAPEELQAGEQIQMEDSPASIAEPTDARAPEAEAPLGAEPAVDFESASAEELSGTAEFAGDLEISAATEPTEAAAAPTSEVVHVGEAPPEEPLREEASPKEPLREEATHEESPPEESPPEEAPPEEPLVEEVPAWEPLVAASERFDVEAHAPPEPVAMEEAVQAEERVMETAAPFVTETMADLYLEQGYPHEALELLLQLSEQRPQDEQLRAKIEHIESVILARRDAAVAAARAERAELSQAVEQADSAEPGETREQADAALSFELPSFEPAIEAPVTVSAMFARMDRVRPRPPGGVTPRPISRLRSDFIPMPESSDETGASPDDPFAFPATAAHAEQRLRGEQRSSGPQPTFNPSTADREDFDAWLRGLKGP